MSRKLTAFRLSEADRANLQALKECGFGADNTEALRYALAYAARILTPNVVKRTENTPTAGS